jgi:hypothetical protein
VKGKNGKEAEMIDGGIARLIVGFGEDDVPREK